jgi:hypothetical protein
MIKVGDRIRMIEDDDYVTVGMTGTVRETRHFNGERQNLAVEFDKPFPYGHSCDGICEPGHGHYVRSSRVELISEEKEMEKVTVAGKDYFVSKGENGELVLKPIISEEFGKKFDDKFTADKVIYNEEARTVTIEYTSDFDKTKPPTTKTQTYAFQKNEKFDGELGFKICCIKAKIEILNDRLVMAIRR